MTDLIETFEHQFNINGIKVDQFIGCSDDDINILRLCQCVTNLPPLYINFMKAFGKNPNSIIHHEWELGFSIVIYLKQFALDEFEALSTSNISVPDDAFVFAQIVQGLGFFYFLTNTDIIDPPVYQILIDDTEPKQIYNSLSEFYNVFVESVIRRNP